MSALSATEAPAREIRVQYYALLREQAGRSDEDAAHAGAHAARVVPRAAREVSLHAAAGNAARGRQCGIRRLVAAARRPAMPWCSFLRWPADERLLPFGLFRSASSRWTRRRCSANCATTAAADSRPSKAGCAITTKATRSRAWNTKPSSNSPTRKARASSPEAVRALRRHARRLRASRRFARHRRRRRLGGRQRRASRRGLSRLPLHHRRSETPGADLEEGTLRQRRFGLGQL